MPQHVTSALLGSVLDTSTGVILQAAHGLTGAASSQRHVPAAAGLLEGTITNSSFTARSVGMHSSAPHTTTFEARISHASIDATQEQPTAQGTCTLPNRYLPMYQHCKQQVHSSTSTCPAPRPISQRHHQPLDAQLSSRGNLVRDSNSSKQDASSSDMVLRDTENHTNANRLAILEENPQPALRCQSETTAALSYFSPSTAGVSQAPSPQWPQCDPSFAAYFAGTKTSPRGSTSHVQELPKGAQSQGAPSVQVAPVAVPSTAPLITAAFAPNRARTEHSKHSPCKQGKHIQAVGKAGASAWAVLTAGMASVDLQSVCQQVTDPVAGTTTKSDVLHAKQPPVRQSGAWHAHQPAPHVSPGLMVRGLLGTSKPIASCVVSQAAHPSSGALSSRRGSQASVLQAYQDQEHTGLVHQQLGPAQQQNSVRCEAGASKGDSVSTQQQEGASIQQGQGDLTMLSSITSSSIGQMSAGTKSARQSTPFLMSRPDTASSYWSAYDLEEGVLTALQEGRHKGRAAAASPAGKLPRSSSASSLTRGSKCTAQHVLAGAPRSISACEASTTAAGPTDLLQLHPALTWDPAVLIPCQTSVSEVPMDEKGRPYPYAMPPPLPGALPTVAFLGAAAAQAAGLQPLLNGPRMFVRYAGIANSPVKTAFKEAGWRVTKSPQRWNVCWGHIPTGAELAAMSCFQRISHFPGTWELGRKDYLYRNVAVLKRSKGDALDLIPRFFVLPRDLEELRADIERRPGQMYIQKPANSSRGRGVRMVVNPSQLVSSEDASDKEVLVQHYIGNPYTINGLKFDMRVYVLATCMDPLRLYVYSDGLARFATQRYSKHHSDLSKRCVHLTNYSVNKGSGTKSAASEAQAGDQECTEHKWSFIALRQHIERDRGPGAWQRLWNQVHDIIAGAVLSAEPRLSSEVRMRATHRSACFEVWGFDILLDDALRAWLMEVNTCPSLAADTLLDRRIKTRMVADAMHLLGPVPFDFDAYEAHQQATRQARLTGLPPSNVNLGSSSSTPTASSRCSTPGMGQRCTSTESGVGQNIAMNSRGKGGSTGPGLRASSQQAATGSQTLGTKSPSVTRPGTSAGAAAISGVRLQPPRTVQDAYQMNFKGLPAQHLPEVVLEAEAEAARQKGWERVFPCTQQPNRYLDLFDTPRALSICLCKYYAHKAGKELQQPQHIMSKRPATTPLGQQAPHSKVAAGVNAGNSNWRPGG